MRLLSHPRRQQVRQLARAAAAVVVAAVAVVLALAVAVRGETALAAALGMTVAGLVACARRWTRRARRSGVGARSERRVRRELAPLRAEGWRLRHALSWCGHGDIDHVAIAPRAAGLAFVIETNTRTYAPEQLARTAHRARWVASRRRRWCPRGAVPVLCVVRPHGIQRSENAVLVVSLDRLAAALRDGAGTWTRPAFMAPARARRQTQRTRLPLRSEPRPGSPWRSLRIGCEHESRTEPDARCSSEAVVSKSVVCVPGDCRRFVEAEASCAWWRLGEVQCAASSATQRERGGIQRKADQREHQPPRPQTHGREDKPCASEEKCQPCEGNLDNEPDLVRSPRPHPSSIGCPLWNVKLRSHRPGRIGDAAHASQQGSAAASIAATSRAKPNDGVGPEGVGQRCPRRSWYRSRLERVRPAFVEGRGPR